MFHVEHLRGKFLSPGYESRTIELLLPQSRVGPFAIRGLPLARTFVPRGTSSVSLQTQPRDRSAR